MEKDYVVSFTLSNGNTYYIGNNSKPILVDINLSFEELSQTARQYSKNSGNIISSKLWNRNILKDLLKDNSIKESKVYSLRYIKTCPKISVYYVLSECLTF